MLQRDRSQNDALGPCGHTFFRFNRRVQTGRPTAILSGSALELITIKMTPSLTR
jgi:hypothetical protein